jgi:hypothetical protein
MKTRQARPAGVPSASKSMMTKVLWVVMALLAVGARAQDVFTLEARTLLLTTTAYQKWATSFIEKIMLGKQQGLAWDRHELTPAQPKRAARFFPPRTNAHSDSTHSPAPDCPAPCPPACAAPN